MSYLPAVRSGASDPRAAAVEPSGSAQKTGCCFLSFRHVIYLSPFRLTTLSLTQLSLPALSFMMPSGVIRKLNMSLQTSANREYYVCLGHKYSIYISKSYKYILKTPAELTQKASISYKTTQHFDPEQHTTSGLFVLTQFPFHRKPPQGDSQVICDFSTINLVNAHSGSTNHQIQLPLHFIERSRPLIIYEASFLGCPPNKNLFCYSQTKVN